MIERFKRFFVFRRSEAVAEKPEFSSRPVEPKETIIPREQTTTVPVGRRFLAVQFDAENTPEGWGVLDRHINHMYVVPIQGQLTYIFSTDKFGQIEEAFKKAEISYRYLESPTGFSKSMLEEAEDWHVAERLSGGENK